MQSLVGSSAHEGDITFQSADLSRLVRYPNGLSLGIRHLVNPLDDTPDDDPNKAFAEALVEEQAPAGVEHTDFRIKKFSTYPGFVFDIKLDATRPSVSTPAASDAVPGFSPLEPVLKVQLATQRDADSQDGSVDMAYEYFKDIRLHQARIAVEVQGLNTLQLANDDATLASGKPFEPFGSAPYAGAALYFSHYELSRKQLDSMTVNMQWVDLPENLSAHYQAYKTAYPNEVPNISNSAFQVSLSMFNLRSWIDQDEDRLLFNTDAEDTSHIPVTQGFTHSAYDFYRIIRRRRPHRPSTARAILK